jgi:hypothetical protein
VQNKKDLWTLYNLATEFSQRPSAIVGIGDEWAAYQFDVATLTWGREVESKITDGKSLHEALGIHLSPEERAKRGEFRSIGELMSRR